MTVPARRASAELLARLIEDPNLPATLRRMPGQAFSALVRRVGVEDAGELVALATTEQIVTAFDEDLFVSPAPGEREAFDPARFVTWLEVMLEAGDATAAMRMAELSEDFVARVISSLVLVLDHEDLLTRLVTDDPIAVQADKLLESSATEEIDGYVLVSRIERGWDALLSLILALDRDHRPLLVRVLDRCAALERDCLDDLERLVGILSGAESLAEDVEAEREQRRARLGFVEPRAARSFLALARMPFEAELSEVPRDTITRDYLRDAPPTAAPVLAALPPGPDANASRETSALEALDRVQNDAPDSFSERIRELVYLANVLIAGATLDDRALEPAEAGEAALATVAFGADLRARATHPSATRPTPEQLAEVLTRIPADLLFRQAAVWLSAHDDIEFVRSWEHLEALREKLFAP